jgi:hypothetical protein
MIQIESAKAPFTSPRLAFQAVTALGRADAMGLLPADEHIQTLDLISFRKAVRHILRAGIARNIQLDLTDASGSNLERTLEHLNIALEESPVPEFEWNRLAEVAWAGTPRSALGHLGNQHPPIPSECANHSR